MFSQSGKCFHYYSIVSTDNTANAVSTVNTVKSDNAVKRDNAVDSANLSALPVLTIIKVTLVSVNCTASLARTFTNAAL